LITYASGRDSEELCVSGEGQMCLQTTISHLVVGRLKLKMRRNWKGRTNQRLGYNTFILNDTNKQEEFNITFSKFQALEELIEEESFDIRWQRVRRRVKVAVTSTCKEVLGPSPEEGKKNVIFSRPYIFPSPQPLPRLCTNPL